MLLIFKYFKVMYEHGIGLYPGQDVNYMDNCGPKEIDLSMQQAG